VQRTRHHFIETLRRLEQETLAGLELAIEALDRVLEALRDHDLELAERVVTDDARIDAAYIRIQEGVLLVMATQAPVAGDLRTLAGLLHSIRCIERIGDQCVNVAKLIPLSGAHPPRDDRLLTQIGQMGEVARSRVAEARDALGRRSVETAGGCIRSGAETEALNREIFRRAVEIGDAHGRREWAMHMVLAARALERIANNARGIASQVPFVVTGETLPAAAQAIQPA
jgi:phosphate transport system protein